MAKAILQPVFLTFAYLYFHLRNSKEESHLNISFPEPGNDSVSEGQASRLLCLSL